MRVIQGGRKELIRRATYLRLSIAKSETFDDETNLLPWESSADELGRATDMIDELLDMYDEHPWLVELSSWGDEPPRQMKFDLFQGETGPNRRPT